MRDTLVCTPTTATDFASGGYWSIEADRKEWSRPRRGLPAPLYMHDRDWAKVPAPLSSAAFYDMPTAGSKSSVVQASLKSERRYASMRTTAAARQPLSRPVEYLAAPCSYSPIVSTSDMSPSVNQLKFPSAAFASRVSRTARPSSVPSGSELGFSSVAADRRAWCRKANGQRTGSAWSKGMRFPREPGPGSNLPQAKPLPGPLDYQCIAQYPSKGWRGTSRALYPTAA